MRLDKTVTIPNYTEIEVEIETDEVLEDMDMDSIVDYVVANYGNKAVLRHMQHNNDFTEDDIEEAVGRKFVNEEEPITIGHENVMKYIHLASPTNKLTMLKAILGGHDDDIGL